MRRDFKKGQALICVRLHKKSKLATGDRLVYVGIDEGRPNGIKVRDEEGSLWFVDDDQVQPLKEKSR